MEQNTTKQKNNFRKRSIIIGVILILAIIASAVYWYLGQLGYVETDDAFIDADKISVSAKMMGRIENLYADEGDTVRAGELLVELDSTDLVARRNQIYSELSVAKESINLAEIQLKQAEQDFKRTKAQYEQNVVPKINYDHALDKVETLKAQVKLAKTKVKNISSQFDIINTQLANTKIFAPHDGIVVKRWSLPGEVIQPGQSIFSIYDLKNIWVTAELEETNINKVSLGDDVRLDVDAFPNEVFQGKIFQLGSNTAAQFALIPPSNASGNFTKVTQRIPVKIKVVGYDYNKRLDENKLGLLPGMSVVVKIKVN